MAAIKIGGCVQEAIRLKFENNDKGSIRYVMNVDGVTVNHAYYIPEGADPDDLALNQADNGYSQYPALTVGEVLEHGTNYF